MNNYSQMPLSALEPQFQAWSKVLSTSHQSANLFFLKNTSLLTRIMQFADWYKDKIRQPLTILDMDAELITSPFSFETALKNLTSSTILIARDWFTRPDSTALEIILQKYHLISPHNLLIVHECAPHELVKKDSITSSLYIRQMLYSLPKLESDLKSYIANISSLWSISLSSSQTKEVLDYCGNIPWLINEYIRLQIDNPDFSTAQISLLPSLKYRVDTFFNGLPELYHDYFSGKPYPPYIQSELLTFTLQDPNNQPIGSWLKQSIVEHNQSLLSISTTKIYYDSIDLSLHFSAGEKRVLALSNAAESVFSRDRVANAFYGKSEADYSDWALSQIISRLRTKLSKLTIPISITPKRGKGYAISRITRANV